MKIGIDYSLSCPAICIVPDEFTEFKYEDCKFYYLTNRKKYEGSFLNGQVVGTLHTEKDYTSEPQRYENIAKWVIDTIQFYDYNAIPQINLEDYSFASKGRVFHIAENMGLLKYKLYREGWKYNLLAPSVIKKFATGKGNANKEDMVIAFEMDTHTDLKDKFDCGINSPITDIADAYFTCKFRSGNRFV